ncbi:hypothetical protein SRHO_G00010970 [Serrasalmus rhombeus]
MASSQDRALQALSSEFARLDRHITALLKRQDELLQRKSQLKASREVSPSVVAPASSCSEVLKEHYQTLLDTARKKTDARIVISGPLPTYRRGSERFSRLFALQSWLRGWCACNGLGYVDNWSSFWESQRSTGGMGFTLVLWDPSSSHRTSRGPSADFKAATPKKKPRDSESYSEPHLDLRTDSSPEDCPGSKLHPLLGETPKPVINCGASPVQRPTQIPGPVTESPACELQPVLK